MGDSLQHLRLGTRGSLLAMAQSQQTANALMAAHHNLHVELVPIKTSGDQIVDRPLHSIGGKGLFVKELELALLDGRIDFAVHSYKDVPVTMPLVDQQGLTIAAVPRREDPSDVMISRVAGTLAELPAGAKIGTGSLRRRSQILAARPDVNVEMIRGNIDTRMKKIDAGFDAVILAAAGLSRAGLFNPATCHVLPDMIPAAGQGALALQCRAADQRTIRLLSILNDPATADEVSAERSLVAQLHGDCHSPIGVLARAQNGDIFFRAVVGRREGEPPVVRAEGVGARQRLPAVVQGVFEQLSRAGAPSMLSGHPDSHR